LPGVPQRDYYLPIAAEASSGTDALNYEIYVKSLADLFSNNDHNVLPAAVGIYAPWGSGKVRPHCFTGSGTAFVDAYIRLAFA